MDEMLPQSLMFTKTIIVKFESLCSSIQILKLGVICLVCGKAREPSSSNNLSGRERSVNALKHLSTRTSSTDIELTRCFSTTEEGLCNVGEWHSHHQIEMPEPSGADRRTVFSNMPHLGLERFVLFIASIEVKGSSGDKRSHDVKLNDIILRPFLFMDSAQKVVKGINN
jgi:hypothetical protein